MFMLISLILTDFRLVRSWMMQIFFLCYFFFPKISQVQNKKLDQPLRSAQFDMERLFVFTVITRLLLRLLRFVGRSIDRRLFLAYRSRIAG